MARLSRDVRDAAKRALWRLFVLAQRFGVDVLPRHFYSGIPSIAELSASEGWRRPRSLVGVHGAELPAQVEFLESICRAHRGRLERGDIHELACRENGAAGYGPVESDVLYAFIATRKPSRVVQVGAGVSTAVILLAAREAGFSTRLTCVDPFPSAGLSRLAADGAIELVREPAQAAALETLVQDGPGSLFFVDSTHAVRPGSEVNRIILEVLPQLGAGTWVHFHDIYLPYDHPPTLLDGELFFPNESVLLHAFLVGNPRVRIRASLSMLHDAAAPALQDLLPTYRPRRTEDGLGVGEGHFPSSTYLEVVA